MGLEVDLGRNGGVLRLDRGCGGTAFPYMGGDELGVGWR